MKLVSILFLVQFNIIECKQNNVSSLLNQLDEQISVDQLFEIKEKYCEIITNKKSEYCIKDDSNFPDIPDYLPPGFILLALSIVKAGFRRSYENSNVLCI